VRSGPKEGEGEVEGWGRVVVYDLPAALAHLADADAPASGALCKVVVLYNVMELLPFNENFREIIGNHSEL